MTNDYQRLVRHLSRRRSDRTSGGHCFGNIDPLKIYRDRGYHDGSAKDTILSAESSITMEDKEGDVAWNDAPLWQTLGYYNKTDIIHSVF